MKQIPTFSPLTPVFILEFMNYIFFLFFMVSASFLYAVEELPLEGRISRINREGHLMRVRVRDENIKFVTIGMGLFLWNPDYVDQKCQVNVLGKSDEYILFKIEEMNSCLRNTPITVGSLVFMSSEELEKAFKVAKDLMDILVKKQLALNGKLLTEKKNLDGFINKIDAVNLRYQTLMDRLQGEWQEKLSQLEEDRISSLKKFKEVEGSLNDVEHKMAQYQIKTKEQQQDLWMLDSRVRVSQKVDVKKAPY